jgi:hypothetical protein
MVDVFKKISEELGLRIEKETEQMANTKDHPSVVQHFLL